MFLVFLIKSNGKVMNRFGETLIHWYEENKRDLPWRDTKDPYKIWISEIILQQTRVVQGYDYYCRFIRRFPDVFALAEAGEFNGLGEAAQGGVAGRLEVGAVKGHREFNLGVG